MCIRDSIDPSSTNLETAVVQNQEGSFRAWFRAAVATVKMQFIIVSVYEKDVYKRQVVPTTKAGEVGSHAV